MSDLVNLSELATDESETYLINTSRIWETGAALRFKSGRLQQAWWCRTTGETEWRDVPEVGDDD